MGDGNLNAMAVAYIAAVSSALLSVYLISGVSLVDFVKANLGEALFAGIFFLLMAYIVVKAFS